MVFIFVAILAALFPAPMPQKHPVQFVQIAYAETLPVQVPVAPTIAELIDQAATAAGVATTTARAVAWCESNYRQLDDNGNILRGPDGHDIGVMQLRETVHAADAKAVGIDIYSLDGNLRYGMLLMAEHGTAPWYSSKGCWQKLLTNPALIPN